MLSSIKEIMIFDGGMGSELAKAGISYTVPEDLNITHSEVIQGIHKSYKDADFITTNTFGLNRIKYKGNYSISEVAERAIENARSAEKKVMFDIGPTGALLKPLGNLAFDEAYEAFKEVVEISKDKVDGYIIETFSDLYELKAAMLAVKENSDKPVFATMTFDKSARTLTGTTPEIMVELLEGLGADAVGVNCSLGPDELYGVIDRILNCAHVPVIIQPNRGLPKYENGKTYYDITVEEFTESVKQYAKMGVSIIGGCCGTDPDIISSISKFKGMSVIKRDNPHKKAVTSYSAYAEITDETEFAELAVDENVTEDDCEDIAYDVLDMADDGAAVVNITASGAKPDVIKALVEKIQEFSNVPLRLISSDIEAIEIFKRYYNGKPFIN